MDQCPEDAGEEAAVAMATHHPERHGLLRLHALLVQIPGSSRLGSLEKSCILSFSPRSA